MDMRTCRKCGETKQLDAFNKHKTRKDGYAYECRVCTQAYVASRQQQYTIEAKTCTSCAVEKLASEFGVRKASVDGLQFKCRVCQRLEASEYRKAHPEAAKEVNRRWYAKSGKAYADKNREKLNAASKEARLKDPETHKARVRDWAARNPDYGARHYAENKEHYKPIRAKHYEENKDDYMTRGRNKRAQVRNAGTHTTKEVEELFAKQDGRCANLFCGAELTKGNIHLDHREALSRGGSNTIDNLQYLCVACNLSKFNRTEEVWYAEQVRRLSDNQR